MSVSSGVSRVYIADVLAPYALNNLEDTDPMYVGKVQPDGRWLMQRYGKTTGEMLYANASNNGAVANYAAAWAARATLDYTYFQNLTGV